MDLVKGEFAIKFGAIGGKREFGQTTPITHTQPQPRYRRAIPVNMQNCVGRARRFARVSKYDAN
jgi:hypothetical protein